MRIVEKLLTSAPYDYVGRVVPPRCPDRLVGGTVDLLQRPCPFDECADLKHE
jgi:hypothetical protein